MSVFDEESPFVGIGKSKKSQEVSEEEKLTEQTLSKENKTEKSQEVSEEEQ